MDSYLKFSGVEFRVEISDKVMQDRVLVCRPDLNNPLKYILYSRKILTPDEAIGYINKFLIRIHEAEVEWKNTQTSLEDSSPS